MRIHQSDMSYQFAKMVISRVRNPIGWVTVEFDDGPEDHPIQLVLLHLPVWEILRKLNRPVCKRHILHGLENFSKSSCINMLTQIYLEICTNSTPEIVDEFVWAVWETINDIDDFGTMELAEFHGTLSLVDLVEIVTDPKLKDIVHLDLNPKFGTDVIEMKMSDAKSRLCKLLGTRGALKNQSLLDYQQSDILNANQIPQVMIAFGLRTEPNDVVIPRPVMGSALSGMKDIVDLSIEQQGARKAAIMNHEAIKTSQYWGRKLHLLVCDIAKVYEEDCGTPLTLIMNITASNKNNFIGKFIQHSDGSLELLTAKSVKNYIDQAVNMRSVMCCRHTDGVCKYCAGLLTRNITTGLNLGINSAATLVSQVSQMILSTKHLIKTLSQIYQLAIMSKEMFERKDDGIHLLESIRKQEDEWFLGIYYDDLYGGQGDLLQLENGMTIPEERFSNIHMLLVKESDGQMKELNMVVDGQSPFLTFEFLLYMKDRYKDLIVDENVIWVPMKGMPRLPVFRTAIINDSMFAYVKSVIKFLENGMLTKYKDCAAALEHFSFLAWSKVPKINILHLEVILRSHMVTNQYDWSIPVLHDTQKVMFQQTVDIIQNRTFSAFYALQGHKKIFSSPYTYVVPRDQGTFDQHFDLTRVYNKKQR